MKHKYKWVFENNVDKFVCETCGIAYAIDATRPIFGCQENGNVDYKNMSNTEIRRKLSIGSENVER